MYFILYNNDFLGFFGHKSNFLNIFFIHPRFRKKEYIKEFWKIVNSKLGNKYYSALYKKNSPAIEFFKKQGAIEITDVHDEKGRNGLLFFFINKVG